MTEDERQSTRSQAWCSCAICRSQPLTSRPRPGFCERVFGIQVEDITEPRTSTVMSARQSVMVGHHWTFLQSIADLAPEVWGVTSGPARRATGRLDRDALLVGRPSP